MKINYVYDPTGIANAYVTIKGEKYRVRSEVLVMKGDKVLINYTKKLNQYNRTYKIPGGSIEPENDIYGTVAKESKEECRVNIKNVWYPGIKLIQRYTQIPEWHKEILWPLGLKYVGCVTFVLCAEYDSRYKGYIAPNDQEPDMLNAKFYYPEQIPLIKAHIKAINGYKEIRQKEKGSLVG